MKNLPLPARIYILLIFGLALGAMVASLSSLLAEPSLSAVALLLAFAIATLDLFPVRLPIMENGNGVEVTVSIAAKIAAILLLPTAFVVFAVFTGTLLAEVLIKRSGTRLVFNVGMMTVNCAVSAMVYHLLQQPDVSPLGSLQNLLALVALGLSDVVFNGLLVSMIIALVTHSPIGYVWAQNYKPLILHDLSMIPIGVFIYILWQYTPWSVLLAALPLLVMRYSYQLIAHLGLQTREALYALARVLDERDEHTSEHSDHVAEHAGLIARTLDLGPEQVELIMVAAALHDIGKVGMRNDILFKAGILTQEERETAKRHAALGGELLQKFPMFDKGAVYVRHHHERWDGTGYPDGLQGEAIPLGARIIAVADSYQAMTEKREYREPLSEETALRELRANAGTQFDPAVVDAFLRGKGVQVSKPVDSPVFASPDVLHTQQSS